MEIPNLMRNVSSFGRMAAGSSSKPLQPAATPAASTNGSSAGVGGASSLKYDPMAARKKGSKPAVVQRVQQQQQQQTPALQGLQGNPAGVNGPAAAAAAGAGGDVADGGGLQQQGSSDSLADLMAGLDANVSSHLDPANLPAFLRTPERRDGQDSLPTQSY